MDQTPSATTRRYRRAAFRVQKTVSSWSVEVESSESAVATLVRAIRLPFAASIRARAFRWGEDFSARAFCKGIRAVKVVRCSGIEGRATGGVISRLVFGGDRLGAAKQLCLASPKLRQEERRAEGAGEKSRCHASRGHP